MNVTGTSLPGEKNPVVDGADQPVDGEVDVGGLGQFAAAAGAEERRAIPVALAGHDLRLEPGRDRRVVLRLPGQGAEYRAGVRPAQERGQLAQLILEVAAQVSVVSRGEELSRVDGESVKQDVGLGGPPAVDGLLRHPGPGGYALDRHAGETALDQQVIGRFQDGQPGFLAAPVPVAVVAGLGASLHAAQRTGPLPRRNVASSISGMTNTLAAPQVTATLSRLFAAAAQDSDASALLPGGAYATASALDKADAAQDVYMPISPEAGQLLYALVRASRPETVVEFGTSFGISTIHLAAAVTDNGTGHVVTTELSTAKVKAARANLEQAGVDGVVTILAGDARQTLADVPGPIGLVLLDGWKDLCLPVLRLLEPRLAPGRARGRRRQQLREHGPVPRVRPGPGPRVRERRLPRRGRHGDQLLDARRVTSPPVPAYRRAVHAAPRRPARPSVVVAGAAAGKAHRHKMLIVLGVWVAIAGGVAALAGLSGIRRVRRLRRDGVAAWALPVTEPVPEDQLSSGPPQRMLLQYSLEDGRVIERSARARVRGQRRCAPANRGSSGMTPPIPTTSSSTGAGDGSPTGPSSPPGRCSS